ncbi:phospholipase/carboxylesterase [Sinobacterium caligoides]|uniref:Phospholipase/carboxylesterase n=1 Tax=Sinobacterium caligoides TaxID=933926 RepID=A0A3N2DDW7_9GAMM|nr:dienelactone hydrolase family protein [Sinobacterium caligoides]ROR97922.1 phospholipase/carboxylesterase [Sinobacterium caligoides]
MSYLPCEIVDTQPEPDAAVIWLHGLGANGHDFVPIVPELQLPASMAVRFVFPHAPSIPITINGGMVMPAWYDILAMSLEREIDEQQILASSEAVRQLIEREISNGIASQRIVLAGFSQGGAVCYQTALSYDKPLAGLMTLSTYFATAKTIVPSAANRQLPIHIFHGSQDPMVPEAMGKHARAALEQLGYQPEYQTYPMEHAVHPREIADISAWLQRVLR